MKKFISGFIIGMMISASIAFADTYNILPNSFPIYVNNTQKEIAALNINGSTWLRLGDIGNVLGASVLFDNINKQINITASGSTILNNEIVETESEATTLSNEDQMISRSKFTPDGLEAYYSDDYKIYGIPFTDINAKYESQGYRIAKLRLALPFCLYKNGEVVLENVEKVGGALEYNYYVNTILPLIQ